MDQTSGAYLSTSSYQARSSEPAARATRATTDGSSRMGYSSGAGAAFGSALTISEGGTIRPNTPNLGVSGRTPERTVWMFPQISAEQKEVIFDGSESSTHHPRIHPRVRRPDRRRHA